MKCLYFFQIEKAGRGVLAFVSKKRIVWLLPLFLLVILAFSSCKDTGVIFFEIQLQKAPSLSFNKLFTSSRNVTASDLLKQIPEKEKKGFTIKSIVIKDSYKAFAQVIGAKSSLSLNLKKTGTFTVTIILEQKEYHDAVITDAEIEVRIKKSAKMLTFDTLATAYKSRLSKDEILRQVQGEKSGYTLKSITVANTAFAQAAGAAPNISLRLKKVGTFTATIVLEHLHYEDAAITGVAFEITKGAAKNLTFDKLVTDKETVTKDEILRQVRGEKTNYTLKSISSITPAGAATVRGTAPDLSLELDIRANTFTFIATMVLEHPLYEDATITRAEFEKEESKYIFDQATKAIIGIRAKYRTYFDTVSVVTFPDRIKGIDVEIIEGSNGYRGIFGNNNSIQTIHLPKNLKIIRKSPFRDCSNLTSITLSDSVTTIGEKAFFYCRSLTSITLPNSVTTLGTDAFAYCDSLTSINIPNSVTTIGRGAFSSCSKLTLTSINIPNSVTSIGDYAFSFCTSLTSINIPNSVATIGSQAFYGCVGLTSVTLSGSVTRIERGTFFNCRSLTSITLPDPITYIGANAFAGCLRLASITLPNSLTTIGGHAFSSCRSLTSVTLPDSVTDIETYAFSACRSLTSVTLPNSITTIRSYLFSGCDRLASITIPNSVTSIESYAFFDCDGLTAMTLPDSVTNLGINAFDMCTNLTLTLEQTVPGRINFPLNGYSYLFYYIKAIRVPRASLQAYRTANIWRQSASKIVGY